MCSLWRHTSDLGLICSPLHGSWLSSSAADEESAEQISLREKDRLKVGAEIKLQEVNIDRARQAELSSTADTFVCDQQFVFVLVL